MQRESRPQTREFKESKEFKDDSPPGSWILAPDSYP